MKKRWIALALGIVAVGAGLYGGRRPPDLPPPLTLHSGTSVARLALSPDGRMLADNTSRGQVLLYDTVTGAQKYAFAVRPYSMRFSPDGRRMLTLSSGPTVQVWNTATGAQLSRFVPPGQATAMGPDIAAFSPDLRWVVVQGGQRCTVYDIATGSLVKTLPLPAPDSQVIFSPDRGLLAISGGAAGGLQMWDTKTWRPVRMLGGPISGITGIRFSPDGTRLALGSAAGLAWWDTRTWKPEGRFPLPSPGGLRRDQYYFSSDNHSVLVRQTSPPDALHQVDCATGRETLRVPRQSLQHISMAEGRAETMVLPTNWDFFSLDKRTTYCIWDTAHKKPLYQIAIPLTANSPRTGDFQARSTDLSDDGHVFAVGGFDDGIIRVWRLP